MNSIDREQVLAEVIRVIDGLAQDWEYTEELHPATRMYADLEIVSLDFVTIAAAMVNRYGPIPFDEFYARLGEQPAETREVTIAQYADFVWQNLRQPTSPSA